MTGKLDFVLQFRDEQVAEELRKRAELGWLDVEFTVFGTAYLKESKMNYLISTDEQDVYKFIEAVACENIYCGNVLSYTERCSVPIGTKEDKELEVKKKLAKILKEIYPKELFEILEEIANNIRDNSAWGWLNEQQYAIEGVFEEEKINFFEKMVEHSYSHQRLSLEAYSEFKRWIAEERSCMDDDFVRRDLFEKTYYGILYEDQKSKGKAKYLEDSLLEYICKRKNEFEIHGNLVSAIYEKTYFYNYSKSLGQLRKDFIDDLKTCMNDSFWEKMKEINCEREITNSYFSKIQEMNIEAQKTYKSYLGKWNVKVR